MDSSCGVCSGLETGLSLQVRVAWVERVLSGRNLRSSELLFQVGAEELSESGCGVLRLSSWMKWEVEVEVLGWADCRVIGRGWIAGSILRSSESCEVAAIPPLSPGIIQGTNRRCTARVFVISFSFGVFNRFRSVVDEGRPMGATQTRETRNGGRHHFGQSINSILPPTCLLLLASVRYPFVCLRQAYRRGKSIWSPLSHRWLFWNHCGCCCLHFDLSSRETSRKSRRGSES